MTYGLRTDSRNDSNAPNQATPSASRTSATIVGTRRPSSQLNASRIAIAPASHRAYRKASIGVRMLATAWEVIAAGIARQYQVCASNVITRPTSAQVIVLRTVRA